SGRGQGVDGHHGGGGGTGQGPVGVLEAVAGDGAHHTAAAWYLPRLGRLEQARHARRRGQLHEHTLFGGQDLVGSHDLAVGDLVDEAAGVVPGLLGQRPGGRGADPDRGGDGARGGDRR